MRDDRWTELKPQLELNDNGNSHSRVLDMYMRMLSEFRRIMDDRERGSVAQTTAVTEGAGANRRGAHPPVQPSPGAELTGTMRRAERHLPDGRPSLGRHPTMPSPVVRPPGAHRPARGRAWVHAVMPMVVRPERGECTVGTWCTKSVAWCPIPCLAGLE